MGTDEMTHEEQKERIRRRVNVRIDESRYEYYPETQHNESVDNDAPQRVGIYVRVSTDDVHQSMSYELQKKYYEEFVTRHPKWKLVDLYADEGISGTSLKHRDQFNRMIQDAKAGKLDLIITKSVSRFARNVVDFLGMVRMLAEHSPRIGVFFEAECIYSLNERSQMALSFQATMAEEESRNKSRSMEASLRMRLDHGLPLTPKLLGFTHNEDGKLIPDPESAHIPKLIFYMYLYGFTTEQIAETLTALGKKTYLGNVQWSVASVTQILKNERYCGDVFTRKTFTPDVISHKVVKNRGERPRSRYLDEHEAIISRDDFIAVQHMLQNARYRNKSLLPELSVIPEGLLKGYVIINTRWSAFHEEDYHRASASAYPDEPVPEIPNTVNVQVQEGEFDLRGFELVHLDFFDSGRQPLLTIGDRKMQFSSECFRRLSTLGYVEVLIHPTLKKIAVRSSTKENRNAVHWGNKSGARMYSRPIPCTAFFMTLYGILGWNPENRYRLYGTLTENGSEAVLIFDAIDPTVYLRLKGKESEDRPEIVLNKQRNRVGAVPTERAETFGKEFLYEQASVPDLSREEWHLRNSGRLFSNGQNLRVTPFQELEAYLEAHLKGMPIWEETRNGRPL